MASKPHARPAHERDPWIPGPFARRELHAALQASGVAGVNTHDRPNVLWKIRRLVDMDADLQFGITGLNGYTFEQVLALMGEAAGFDPDPSIRHGLMVVDAEKVLDACAGLGDRLAAAAAAGERVLLATGHPTGLPLLYQEVGKLLQASGAKLLRPLEGYTWEAAGRRRQIRYLGGVAVLTDRASALHTHSPEAMQLMLEQETPDLVFADHGFAGAAIEAGIDTVSIADVNDPALVVARDQGRAGPVIVMDDNVQPESYWPCFQVIASRIAART